MKRRKSSAIVTAMLLLLIVAVSVSILLYKGVIKLESKATGGKTSFGSITCEAVKAGRGFIILYLRSLGFSGYIDKVYFYDADNNVLTGTLTLPGKIRISSGETVWVKIPFMLVNGTIPTHCYIKVGTSNGYVIGVGSEDLQRYLESARKAVFGFLAGRTGTGLDLSPSYMHWVYINFATMTYKFRYISGAVVRDASGKATLLFKNSLDLSKLSWSQRYALGPIVIFFNPYYATKDYRVSITDIYGSTATYDLTPLTSNPDVVVYDVLLCWEDLWWPGTTASLDNYIDHVVRITVFINNTARIEIMHASGGFLHMFILNPPPFDTIPSIVNTYLANGYRLPASDGIVYVKAHGAYVPPISVGDIWDPVNGVWITTWPPVFWR